MRPSKEQNQETWNKKDRLNEVSLALAKEVLTRHSIATIRAKGLSNIDRWHANGVWTSAFAEWQDILSRGSDEDVINAMTSMDQRSVRLRQSAPYPGLIDEETRRRIFDEILGH